MLALLLLRWIFSADSLWQGLVRVVLGAVMVGFMCWLLMLAALVAGLYYAPPRADGDSFFGLLTFPMRNTPVGVFSWELLNTIAGQARAAV